MKPDDLKFVREIRVRINPVYAGVAGTESYERTRLLTLLYESEAMRKRVEYWYGFTLAENGMQFSDKSVDAYLEKNGDKRRWTLVNWIAAVRKEIEGEEIRIDEKVKGA